VGPTSSDDGRKDTSTSTLSTDTIHSKSADENRCNERVRERRKEHLPAEPAAEGRFVRPLLVVSGARWTAREGAPEDQQHEHGATRHRPIVGFTSAGPPT